MTDLALQLLRHGYRAVEVDRRARRGGTTYPSRMMGRRAVVLGGPDGARAFYDESLVRRKGAVPPPLGWLLFGRGAVHSLDDVAHRDRKLMFLEALSVEKLGDLYQRARTGLERARETWPGREVSLHEELVRVYGSAVVGWAGLELPDDESERVGRLLAETVDGFGFAGTAYLRAWRARVRTDRWAAGVVRDVRRGRREAPEGSALAEVARARNLDARTAGVELLNVLRPTVAVAWLGTFAGLRLAREAEWRGRLAAGDPREALAFAQEVRRTTPFAPVLGGRARRSATVGGVPIRSGDRLVLDVLGIDHDPTRWADPREFRPERFLTREPDAFALVPQGGGHPSGHRCPGENATLGLLVETVRVLATTRYDVAGPADIDLGRIPTLPDGGLVLTGAEAPARQA